MYSIFCDGVCIHHGPSPDENCKVIDPKLKLSDNSAGTLTLKIPSNNVGYNIINRLTSEIVVKRKNYSDNEQKAVYEEIWSGRVIEEKVDFWKNREITCEGELGYLNDTTQPPNEYHDISPRTLLETFVNIHNQKCEASKRFSVGVVTVTDPNDSLYRYTNFESTYEAIKDKLIDRLGGHLRIRKVNGVRYLDYINDDTLSVNEQTIEFGKNLVEFSKNFNASDLVTVVVPLGCNVTELGEENTYDALEEYLTVESVNSGSIYVTSQEAINNYGWIETVVHWNDVKTPSILLSKGQQYLADAQFEDLTLELSAVDMHNFDIHTEAIWLLDKIRCISRPHGMDRIFPILNIDIPLDKPEDTKYTLGDKVKSTGISASVRDTNNAILKKINELPSTSSVLKQAKDEASELLNMTTNGYITITTEEDQSGKYHSDSLYISNVKDYTAPGASYWRWNFNGLGFWKNSSELGLALTMDGTIVADRVLTGQLGKKEWGNYWNMETGEFVLSPKEVTAVKVYKNVYVQFDPQSSSESINCDWVDVVWKNKDGTYNYVRRGGNTWDIVYIKEVYDGEMYIYWRTDSSVVGYRGFRVTNITHFSGSAETTITGTRSTPWYDAVSDQYKFTSNSSDAYANIHTDNFPSAVQYTNNERKLWTININNVNAYNETLDSYTQDKVDTLDDSLNQESVFNRLTNNGTVQGIQMHGGQLYINASYINTGTMSANRVRTGKITSANNTMEIDLDNNKITSQKLIVSATNFTLTEEGNMTANNAQLNGTINFRTQSDFVNAYMGSSGLVFRLYSTTAGAVYSYGEASGTYVYRSGLHLSGTDEMELYAPTIELNGTAVFNNSIRVGENAYGLDGYYWVKDSNDNPMYLHYLKGILVETGY